MNEKRKETDKSYYEKNKEQILMKQKLYREKNREIFSKIGKRYYKKHKVRLLEDARNKKISNDAMWEQQTAQEQFDNMWKFVKKVLDDE